MKSLAFGMLAIVLTGCSSEPAGGETPSTTVVLADGAPLPDAAFYFITDEESGAVRETVLLAHNSSNHCPDGCTAAGLGTPIDGDELRLLTLVFQGEVDEGSFDQGGQFIQGAIRVGTAGCGEPDQIGPDGEVIHQGHPPGTRRYESMIGKVKILEVSGAAATETIRAEVDVQFDIGHASGSLLADHCEVLDSAVIE